MKRKIRFVILICATIFLIAAAINIPAFIEFRKISSYPNFDKCQMSAKDYTTGRNIDIVDPKILNEIGQDISNLQYGGVFVGRTTYISPNDCAYELTVFSEDLFVRFMAADSQHLSRVNGKNFTISIKNYDDLYKTLESVFE